MDLSLVFCLAIVADAALSWMLPVQRRVGRFVCTSILFAVRTTLIAALIGSPLHPVFRSQDLPHEFWLQVLTCCWWGLAARDLIRLLALTAAIRKSAVENRLLTDIIAASIYEGEVIEMNWRSTHLKNGANDVVIVPNSAIAKMRIQNHSAASKRYY